MYLNWLEPVILGVISFWFIVTTSDRDSNHNVIQPVGPRMCDHLCTYRIGCSGYLYTPLNLSCRLIVEKTSSLQQSLQGTYYHKVSKIYQAKRNMICLPNSKIFYTRRNIPQCRRRQLKPSRKVKFTRLLMLSGGWKYLQGRQLYLRNKTVSSYPYIRNSHTSAVAYISSTRKLVISTRYLLFLMTLDDTDRRIITNVRHVTGITVDEEQELVFLTSVVNNTIHVMTTEGKDLKLITTLAGKPGQIAADSQRQVIYVAVVGQHIARYTYKGQPEEVIVRGYIHSSLYFSYERNVLYYIEDDGKTNICNYFLSNETKFTVLPNIIPSKLYVYSNTFYFSPTTITNGGSLFVKNASRKESAAICIKTGFDKHILDIVVCAIP